MTARAALHGEDFLDIACGVSYIAAHEGNLLIGRSGKTFGPEQGQFAGFKKLQTRLEWNR